MKQTSPAGEVEGAKRTRVRVIGSARSHLNKQRNLPHDLPHPRR
jgi:hypothetical protein